jgi:nucleotide-binding universal stress UspA family protein
VTTDHNPIVVGVDDSPSSRSALYWAVHEATSRQSPLEVVYAWRSLYRTWPGGGPGLVDLAVASREYGEGRLASLVARVQSSDPEASVTGKLLEGRPSEVLLKAAAAAQAQMLVVGARGVGGFDGLLLGSVGLHVVSNAPCPVVVVRVARRPVGPIVVGIDGSTESKAVLSAAFDEASVRNTRLDVIHVLYVHSEAEGVPDRNAALATAKSEASDSLEALLADGKSTYPNVKVRTDLPVGYPAEILISASTEASMLVMGSHGGGGFTDMGLGSVAHAVVHHARCPVMLLRQPAVSGHA